MQTIFTIRVIINFVEIQFCYLVITENVLNLIFKKKKKKDTHHHSLAYKKKKMLINLVLVNFNLI
jgi:hypothetical protein